MLYAGAIEGSGYWLRPDQATRMTDVQAALTTVVARDDQLAHEIGLNIQPDRNLPDIVMVDLGLGDPLLVFVEVVATAGPVSEARRTA